MKRICILLLLCLMVLSPMSVCAKEFEIGDTDLTIEIDDSSWYVFTRENIEDNAELDELGISQDYMHDVLYNNLAYIDALLLSDDGNFVELIVRKTANDSGLVNLSNYDDENVMAFADELAKKQGSDDYRVYENEYKFIKSEYVDSNLGYYIYEFVTVVNKENYTFTFQSNNSYDVEMRKQMQKIIDSIEFDIDESLEEPGTIGIVEKVLIGAAVGGGVGAVIGLVNKKKKKQETEQ